MITVYLYPGDASPNNVILSDPTVLRSGAVASISLSATEGSDLAAGSLAVVVSLALAATEGADIGAGTVSVLMLLSLAATDGADTCSASVTVVASSDMAIAATEGADTLLAAMAVLTTDLLLSATEGADLAAFYIFPVLPPVANPDRFQAPAKKGGVIGRLSLDRPLSDYGFDILVSISGCSSETIQIIGESASGKLLGPPEIQPEKSSKLIPDAIVQNGNYVIHIDDLMPDWDNLAFIKSGSSDRISVVIEGPFDWVDAR
jgi:hypothetical protein